LLELSIALSIGIFLMLIVTSHVSSLVQALHKGIQREDKRLMEGIVLDLVIREALGAESIETCDEGIMMAIPHKEETRMVRWYFDKVLKRRIGKEPPHIFGTVLRHLHYEKEQATLCYIDWKGKMVEICIKEVL
jgi:hypothetical protein